MRAREPGDVLRRDAGPDEDGERGHGLEDAADVVGGGLGAGGGPGSGETMKIELGI